MTENASNSFSRKKRKKMLVFPKNAEKNASTIEKGLVSGVVNIARPAVGFRGVCGDCCDGEIGDGRVGLGQ